VITGIRIVGVPVGDSDEAIRFFCDVLGMEKLKDAPMGDGHRYVEVAPPGSATVLAPYTWYERPDVAAPLGGYSRVVLMVDDVHKAYKELTARGVEFTGEPFSDQGGTFTGIKDPWGNVFVLADNKKW
jgi:catechol 2,3-dioxygenase-like lactoylglutathione lyase family enzyme